MVQTSRQGKRFFLGTLMLSLAFGCSDQRNKPDCSSVYASRMDESGFEILERGIALHKNTGLVVTQCAAGQRLINFRCRGEAQRLGWHDAMNYAAEIAEKTGEPWRLPTKSEMPKLLETQCINPAANPFVFPDMEVANFWTSSQGLHQEIFRCSTYSYQGRVFCRQLSEIKQPFLLVRTLQ